MKIYGGRSSSRQLDELTSLTWERPASHNGYLPTGSIAKIVGHRLRETSYSFVSPNLPGARKPYQPFVGLKSARVWQICVLNMVLRRNLTGQRTKESSALTIERRLARTRENHAESASLVLATDAESFASATLCSIHSVSESRRI